MEENVHVKFINLYKTKVELLKKKCKLEKIVKMKLKDQAIIKASIKMKEEEQLKRRGKSVQKDFVFTLSKGVDCFFELLNIGKLADSNFNKYHNMEFIYPIGYKSKRIFLPYKDSKSNDKGKMVYTCEILDNGMSITSEDGHVWNGKDIWKSFSESFNNNFEFKSIEHFFGLTYKPIQYKIEKLGDASVFINYVLLDDRKTK